MKIFIPRKLGVITMDHDDHVLLIKNGWCFTIYKARDNYLSVMCIKTVSGKQIRKRQEEDEA